MPTCLKSNRAIDARPEAFFGECAMDDTVPADACPSEHLMRLLPANVLNSAVRSRETPLRYRRPLSPPAAYRSPHRCWPSSLSRCRKVQAGCLQRLLRSTPNAVAKILQYRLSIARLPGRGNPAQRTDQRRTAPPVRRQNGAGHRPAPATCSCLVEGDSVTTPRIAAELAGEIVDSRAARAPSTGSLLPRGDATPPMRCWRSHIVIHVPNAANGA